MKRKNPSNIKRNRKHGFKNRNDSKSGRDIINNRRKKGRKNVAVTKKKPK